MRYISIIILLVLCLTLLLFTGCMINTVTPEIASGNLENQEDINPSSDNTQSPSTGLVCELGTEEPGTIYPQKWATGTGTEEDPWANGCVESAVAACPAGGTVYLKAGYYQLAALVNVNKSMNIIGEGIGNTIVLTADAHGFYGDGVDYVTIKGLTVDGDAQTTDGTTYRACIVFNESTYLLFEDIEVKNSARYGWDGNDNNHCTFKNFYAHDNYRHGIHPMANRAGTNMYNTYRDVYCWNNGVDGISDIGSEDYPDEDCYNIYNNVQCWNNGTYGLQISRMHNVTISNSSFSGNGLVGLFLYDDEDFKLTNVIAKNNNSGIVVNTCDNVTLTSCQSYDDESLQGYGVVLSGASTGINVLSCILSPNTIAEIYNPNGIAINLIKEKMLAKF